MATKKAVLVGINYKGTVNQLDGCINDMIQWWSILQDVYGFDQKDIVFLRDDKADFKPTKQRILQELTNMVNAKPEYSVIAFSCHGTQLPDINKEENDGFDECVVPCDYRTGGIITDDELNAIMKNNTSTCLAIFDCCHSGTILDLQNTSINAQNTPTNAPVNKGQIICMSGCRDNETSAEVYNDINMIPQGALTITMINNLRKLKYYPNLRQLITYIQSDIRNGGLSQNVAVSSQFPIYQDTMYPFINQSLNQPVVNQSQILAIQAQVSTLQAQVSTLQTQNATLQTQNTSLQNTLNRMNRVASDNTQLILTNSNLNKQITTLQNQINALNAQLRTRR